MLVILTILFLAACYVLARSGSLVVKSLTRIAAYYHWSEFLVAFVLVSFATTLPEFFVGISSALNKTPTLSLGNLIGANIVNLTLVMGLATVLAKGIKIRSDIAHKDVLYTFLIILIPIILLLDGILSRLEGGLLILIFLIYFFRLFYINQKRFPKFLIQIFNALKLPTGSETFVQEYEAPVGEKKAIKKISQEFIWFGAGVVFLIFSAQAIVFLAVRLARDLGLPMVLLGLVILSIGTTLPELTFGIRAVMAGRKEMILGNLFGAMTVNLVLILGVVALIEPVALGGSIYLFLLSAFLMLAILLIFAVFIRTQGKLSWQEGMGLILFYIVFVVLEFLVK